MSKKLFANENLIGIAAMIISLTTLVVFVYQTNLMKKQQYMSVYPHLSFTHMRSYSPEYEFVLLNKGIGPAFIKTIEIQDSTGKNYPSINDYLKDKLEPTDTIIWTYSGISLGSLIQEKEEVDLIGFSEEEYGAAYQKTMRKAAVRLRKLLASDHLEMTITYESIYGESWTTTTDSNIPVKN